MDVLTQAEIEKMTQAARRRTHGNGKRYAMADRDAIALHVLAGVGLRVSELVAVRLEHLSFADIPNPHTTGSDRHAYLHVRAWRERVVPVRLWLAMELRELLERDPEALEMSTQAVRDLVSEYARRAGILRPVAPVMLRRACAQAQFGTSWAPTLTILAERLGLKTVEAAANYLVSDVVGHLPGPATVAPGGSHVD